MDREESGSENVVPLDVGSGGAAKSQISQLEQNMADRLKGGIDHSGRYKYRLDDLAAGYAVGRNLPLDVARKSVQDTFEKVHGMQPKAYLERHYELKRQSNMSLEERFNMKSSRRGR